MVWSGKLKLSSKPSMGSGCVVFQIHGFFTDKFETSQDAKHCSAVALHLSHQLSWYDGFTEGSIGRKGTSCRASRMYLAMIAPDFGYQKGWGKNHLLADFNTKAVSIWVSCKPIHQRSLASSSFSKSKGSLFSGLGLTLRSQHLEQLELQQLEQLSNLSLGKSIDEPTFLNLYHEVACRQSSCRVRIH